jgi:hypothetical protein
MSEQNELVTTIVMAAPPTTASACPHPEAVGKRWGDLISPEQQAELRGISTDGRQRQIMASAQGRLTENEALGTVYA